MLADQIAKLETLETPEEIWEGLQAALRAVGIDFIIYLTVDQEFSNPILRSTIKGLYDTFPVHRDPFLSHCCNSYAITKTGFAYLPNYDYLPTPAKNFIAKAKQAGWITGLGIPMRLRGSTRFGGFNLGTRLEKNAFEMGILPRAEELRLSCLLLHRRFEELSRKASENPISFRQLLVAPDHQHLDCLTPREREVAYLVASGLSRKECARLCSISPNTVSDYMKSIYSKLGVNDRVKLTHLLKGQKNIDQPLV